jgi:hypothetical protein
MPRITIKLEHGQILSIEDIPTDTVIEVLNYDVEQRKHDQLSEDDNGRPCEIKEWHPPE